MRFTTYCLGHCSTGSVYRREDAGEPDAARIDPHPGPGRNVRGCHPAADQHGHAGLCRCLSGRHPRGRDEHRRHHRRLSQRAIPDARRRYLLIRDCAEQRHGRPHDSRCCAHGSRARRLHTVGDVRDNRAVDRIGSARAGRRRRHRAHCAGVRQAVPNQRVADGHDGDPRRPGRRLLADQHLRRHRQQHRGQGGADEQPADTLPGQPCVQRCHRCAVVRVPGRPFADRPNGPRRHRNQHRNRHRRRR